MTLDNHGTASCECPDGGKPHGSCSRLAAFRYSLEAYDRLVEETRLENFCTSHLQVWNYPRNCELLPHELKNTAFLLVMPLPNSNASTSSKQLNDHNTVISQIYIYSHL